MSVLWELLRWVDPVQQRERDEALRRQREDWPPDVEPDQTDLPVAPPAAPARAAVCRVCGEKSTIGQFCRICLADTLVPID